MSGKTKIEWTDVTWNPIRGCSMAPGSETGGCLNCYAARQALRSAGEGGAYEGLARMTESGPRWTGKILPVIENWEEPLHWKTPRRIFVNSMSDLFHPNVERSWLIKLFFVMATAYQHTFQILTKRPREMQKFFSSERNLPPIRAHFGVSVENQATASERIPILLDTDLPYCPGFWRPVRWISYEPALGPVDLMPYLERKCDMCDGSMSVLVDGDGAKPCPKCLNSHAGQGFADNVLNWVVCGGESGPSERPMHPDWARSVRDQCQKTGVPFLFKQWGEWGACANFPHDAPVSKKNLDRLHDHPVIRVGKKKAGRLLDGREWNEFPKIGA